METATVGSAATAGSGTSAPSATKINSDFDTFLRMLTTQLQNQDPMNPMDSSDFAVQLATFSQVEQAQRTNQLLEGMTGQLGMTGMAQLAAWVGMEARSAAPVFFQGDPVTLSATPDSLADDATLVVKDATGAVVARQQVAVTTEPFTWEGTSMSGGTLPTGRYSFELESLSGSEVISTTPVQTYGRISEAKAGTDGTVLVMAGGIEVSADAVTAIRKP